MARFRFVMDNLNAHPTTEGNWSHDFYLVITGRTQSVSLSNRKEGQK